MKTFLAALALSSALTFAAGTAAHAADPAKTIRILCPTWSGFAPIFVAKDLGYFKQLGIAVDVKFDDERADVMAAMARGDIEMNMRTVGEYQGRPRDASTTGTIIGTIDESLGGDGVIASGDIKSVADLKGKIVAAEPNIPGRLLLQLELKKAGLSLGDLKMKQIQTADSVSVFADPSVAATVSYQPYLSQLLKVDAARKPWEIVSSAQFPGYIVDVIIARNDDLKAHPEKYKKFLIGIYKAIAFFHTDPQKFIKLAAPHFQLSPADFEASIKGSLEYTTLAETQAEMGKPGAPGSLYKVFDTIMGLNLDNGAADHKLSADASIDNTLIAGITAQDIQ